MLRLSLLVLAAFSLAATASANPATTVVESAKKRCCFSKKGPEPVPYTGSWLPGEYTRAECVAKKYGFWDGDAPNVARKVCAVKREWPPNDPVDPVPPPHDRSGPRVQFYDQEKFTVTYDVTGSPESGTIVEHVIDWGVKRAEIKDMAFSYGPVKNTTKQRVIYDGPDVVTVDLKTGGVTKITNPLYEKIVASMNGRSGVEYGKAWAASMGAVETGKTGTYAGHACDEWKVASLGTTMCIMKSGITLFTSTKTGPVSMVRKAREVKLGDGGPASAYAYDASKVQVAPNLTDIMKKARGNN